MRVFGTLAHSPCARISRSRGILGALPLTGVKCVDRIITDYCVLDVTPRGLKLTELAPGVTAEQVQSLTEPRIIVEGQIKQIAA